MTNSYTDKSGKFASGNPGKPKGARHKATRAVEDLLEGEAEGLTRKAVDLALEGDTTALRLCLERIAPPRKDVPVRFPMPALETANDAVSAASSVISAVSNSELTPGEGARVMALIDAFRRNALTDELERRVLALEGAAHAGTKQATSLGGTDV